MTVNDCIIDLLKTGWTSRADAFREVGTLDLPKRVSEIRRGGIEIESRRVEFTTRLGRKSHYNEYRIKEEK